jgi:copper(I)-binding protein
MRVLWPALVAIAAAASSASAAAAIVQIQNAWVRTADAGQNATQLYADITTDVPLTLVGARCDVAKQAVLLVTDQSGERDVAKPVRSLHVAAGETFRLAPRGAFFELRDVERVARTGESVAFTLEFAGADGRPVHASGEALVRGIMPREREYELRERATSPAK